MQAPLIVFAHVKKQVAVIATGPANDRRLTELLASQRKQIATSGRPSAT
jgi:hypothetical protein